MKHNIFRGLGIALITPFTENGAVDYDAMKRIVEYQLSNGADFLCILATTGETPCLTKQEKEDIKKYIIDLVAGRIPILMGCGGNNTSAVVDELQNGDFKGIDGVLSVCPYSQAVARRSISAFQGYFIGDITPYRAVQCAWPYRNKP